MQGGRGGEWGTVHPYLISLSLNLPHLTSLDRCWLVRCTSCHIRCNVFLTCVCGHRFLESYPQVATVSMNQAPEVRMDLQAASATSAVSGNDPFLLDWERKKSGRSSGPATRLADDVESQYKRIYEDRVNPFTDFNRCASLPACL